jgi:hypothetical protein
MKTYLTLDYELFLGSITGSVELCLVKPMEYLCDLADKYQVKFTVFVDAVYLLALKRFRKYHKIDRDYATAVRHLLVLAQKGHAIGFHLHPHWAYSEYNGQNWITLPDHYKLSDIPLDEASAIIKESKYLLEEVVGMKVSTFRAGGFSIQPFEPYSAIFNECGLSADSSVIYGMYYNSDNQKYDYRNAPYKDKYQFYKDICAEDTNGPFAEYPIATHNVSPIFWWKLSLLRILRLNKEKHKTWGDGKPIETNSQSILSRLTRPQMSFACMDGYKSSLLINMRESQQKVFGQDACFVIIGHPKLTTPYSLKMLEQIIKKYVEVDDFMVLNQ